MDLTRLGALGESIALPPSARPLLPRGSRESGSTPIKFGDFRPSFSSPLLPHPGPFSFISLIYRHYFSYP